MIFYDSWFFFTSCNISGSRKISQTPQNLSDSMVQLADHDFVRLLNEKASRAEPEQAILDVIKDEIDKDVLVRDEIVLVAKNMRDEKRQCKCWPNTFKSHNVAHE